MEVLYLLIPLSVVLVLLILGLFGWAVTRDQFEDLEREGQRILDEDEVFVEIGQGRVAGACEQWQPQTQQTEQVPQSKSALHGADAKRE